MRAFIVFAVLLTLASIRSVCAAENAGVAVSTCTDCHHASAIVTTSPTTAPVAQIQSPRIAVLLQQGGDGPTDEGPLHVTRQLAQTHSQGGAPPPPKQQQQHGDHKPLFPVSGLEVAVLVIAGVVLFIAAGAGMGGGPVLVPLYLVAGLNNTAAVALSNSTILAGSVGNTLVNIFKRHPYKNKPMIDWDLVLLMEPPTLIGAIAGSYINKLLPAWITSVLLVLLLALMTVRVAQRAAHIYKRESAARREEAAAAAAAAQDSILPAATGQAFDHLAAQVEPAQQPGYDSSLGLGSAPAAAAAAPPRHSHSQKADRLAGSYAAKLPPAAPAVQPGSSGGDGGAAAVAANGGAVTAATDADGVEQLLAEERAARVGPSDQPPPPVYNSSSSSSRHHNSSSHDSSAAAGTRPQQHLGLGMGLQSPPQKPRPLHNKHRPAGPAGASSPFSLPSERPASPMGRAESAPPVATGYASPYRGTLSTVPSSVLLNLELEGNISEAALQRLAMLEQQGAAAGRGSAAAGQIDALDASLASMDGVGVGSHSWWWWQQQPRQGQGQGQQQQRGAVGLWHRQQQQPELLQAKLDEPPCEAECRLLYAPPDHTRRDSWELAWEDDEQQQAAHSAGLGGSLVHHSTPSPAAVLNPPALLSPDSTGAQQSRGGQQGLLSPPAAASGAAAKGVTSPVVAAAVGRARVAAPAAVGPGPPRASAGSGVVEMVSAPHQLAPAAAPGMVLPPAHAASSQQQQRPGPSTHLQAPEVAGACKADAVASMLAAEAAQVPLLPAALLLVMFLAVLLSSLLSKMAPCGSAVYWVVQWAVAPVLLGVWWYSRARVLAKVALKKEAQLDFHGEVRWTPRKSLVFPAICSIAGIIAGMFGLGGAVVKTPLMLELGVHPSVTAATTQTMLLLTSSASSIVYAQLGDTPWDWATVMLPMAFAATLAGQAAIDWLVRKIGRSSMVVLVLAAFFIVATCLSIYTMAGAVKAVAASPELLGRLGKICR